MSQESRGRLLRHYAICPVLAVGLRKVGRRVEEVIVTTVGNRKPNLVCVKGELARTVDAQVVSGYKPLSESHKNKTNYHGKNTDLLKCAAKDFRVGPENIKCTTYTLNWRVVWVMGSAMDLLEMGLENVRYRVSPHAYFKAATRTGIRTTE